MEAWDQEKLEDVVNKKHGSKNKALPPTTIVRKNSLSLLYFTSPMSNSMSECHTSINSIYNV